VTEAQSANFGENRLSAFLSNNPEAICSAEGEDEVITYPWGINSVTLLVSKDNEALVTALNNLRPVFGRKPYLRRVAIFQALRLGCCTVAAQESNDNPERLFLLELFPAKTQRS
jgi:hypothetical protein